MAKTAILRVTITTWFRNGKYRNNIVEIPMVDGMVDILIKDGNKIAMESVAECLAKNQTASVEVIDGGNVVRGMVNINTRNTQEDEWQVAKNREED